MKKVTILFFIVFTSFTFAQDKVKVNAQIRPRFNINKKDFNSNITVNSFTELRTRMGVLYKPTKNLSGFIQIQDSRIFGTEANTLASSLNVDLHQAYFIINNFFSLPLNLKIGRMELSYSSQRLLGAVGWDNVGRSFDGAVLNLHSKSLDIDFIAAQTVENAQAGDSLDMFMYSAYGNLKSISNFTLHPFVIAEYKARLDFSRYTIGLYFSNKKKKKGFYNELEAAYQLGTQNSTQDIAAFMVTYSFNYTLNTSAKPSFGAGIDYLSGDDGKDATKFKVFNTLYATNHKFYGYMDYFLNIPKHTFGLGLMDVHVKTTFKAAKKLNFALEYHLFNANEDYTLVNGSTSKNFGSEIDFTLAHKYSKNVKFVGGFSFFTPGDIFKEKKGKDNSTWTYLMAIVNL